MPAAQQPDLRPEGSWMWKPRYVLMQEYHCASVRRDGTLLRITIPTGFQTDGSSEWIARLVFAFLPSTVFWLLGLRADGPHRAAALVHDYLYRTQLLSRAEADYTFLRLARAGGMPLWQAVLRYCVLRLLGWTSY